MDHHCRWISNCVGIDNRKFYMLMLLYIILTLTFSAVWETLLQIQEYGAIIEGSSQLTEKTIVRSVGLISVIAFETAICLLFRFQVERVLTNSTTIEHKKQ